jgi:hypothetical protein
MPGFEASASAAYLFGVCFPKEADATKNAGTLGFVTQTQASLETRIASNLARG